MGIICTDRLVITLCVMPLNVRHLNIVKLKPIKCLHIFKENSPIWAAHSLLFTPPYILLVTEGLKCPKLNSSKFSQTCPELPLCFISFHSWYAVFVKQPQAFFGLFDWWLPQIKRLCDVWSDISPPLTNYSQGGLNWCYPGCCRPNTKAVNISIHCKWWAVKRLLSTIVYTVWSTRE